MSRLASRAVRRVRALLFLALLPLPAALAAQDSLTRAEFAGRRSRLLAMIPDGIALILGGEEHPEAVRFRQSPDFYYLTGIEEPGAVLVLNGASKTAVVFALKRPAFGTPDVTPRLREVEKPQEKFGLNVVPMENVFTYLSFYAANPAVKKMYAQLTPPDRLLNARSEARTFDAQAMDHPLFGHRSDVLRAIERAHAVAPHLELADVSPMLDELRWVKSPFEIERLRRAGKIGADAVAEAIRGTRPGMYEYEIAAAAQYVNTRSGARGDAFLPIVPSGPLTPIVHYEDNRRQMQAGEVVYMDYGSDFEYYESDITRTWPVSGKFTADQEKMYRCILEARNAIIAAMKPGATIESLKDVAEPIYAKYGYGEAFKSWGRYVGHFVGISVHDVGDINGPWASKPFVAGTVFNVEPIVDLPDRKIHVRLEDTIVITENGAENLTASVPAELEPLYALIKQRGVNSTPLSDRRGR